MSQFPSQLPTRLRFAVLLVLLILGMRQVSKAQAPRLPAAVPVPAGQTPGGSYVPVGEGASIKVNFPNAPIQAIIPFYTQLTGKKLILDSALQGEQLHIISPQMLTKRDAIAFIEATLLLNGYAIINVDASTAKLINQGGGKSPTADGLKVYNSLRDLPQNEEICHYVLPLQFVSADEASKAFQQVIKLHVYGAMTGVSNDTALIITENSATIRSICEIAQIIDVPPTETANEMIKLERSDVELVAEIVNEIFEQEEKAKASTAPAAAALPNAVARPGAPAVPTSPAGYANTTGTNPAAARVKVFAYRRTNELLVIGRPVDITYIKGLVEKLDKQSDGSNFLKRRLKYLDVLDFLSVAYNALAKDTDIQSNEGVAASGGGSGGGGSRRRSSPTSNSPSTDARNSNSNSSNNGNNSTAYGSNTGMGGAYGNNSGGQNNTNSNSNRTLLDKPEDVGAPESMVVGKTLLIGDPQSNSLIVSGSPEHIERIDQLLQEMDIRPQQIYISAIIGQLSLGKNFNYGVDFLQLLSDFSVNRNGANSTTAASTTTTTTASTSNIVQFPAGFGHLNLYGQIGSLSNYIKVIDSNNNFKVLATPSIYAKNAAKSVISSGQRIAVPANILTNGGFSAGVANTSVSVTYRDVVLKLEVIPLINSDEEVTLRIAQINDTIIGSQTIGNNTVPTIGTQELLTEVAVKNGATVVLGGLITEKTTKAKNGVIGLSRIPLIGNLFGTTQNQSTREELLIFIQPRIVRSDDPLDTPNGIESTRSKVYEEAMQFASPGLENIPRAIPVRE
jgi:general secretion pathway protein D